MRCSRAIRPLSTTATRWPSTRRSCKMRCRSPSGAKRRRSQGRAPHRIESSPASPHTVAVWPLPLWRRLWSVHVPTHSPRSARDPNNPSPPSLTRLVARRLPSFRAHLTCGPAVRGSARAFCERLCTRDPQRRLGCLKAGAADVRGDPFLGKTNWRRLEKKLLQAPYTPQLSGAMDASSYSAGSDPPYSSNDFKANLRDPKAQTLFAEW